VWHDDNTHMDVAIFSDHDPKDSTMDTNRSEYEANLSLAAKHSDVEQASWMTPSPVRRQLPEPSLIDRIADFLGALL
jgi:hypothetical protein